eukprot:TRINITY_DN23442_c0_g1_i1.p1 TRINITY_DN23442_c0_g1~~TRINITY_DN23442_c0_g1_i1.p1  ORF type:complete len:375 (+),score=87.29 TRINITY_DN23442_c0_g1_i1:76-1125(+)
MSPSVQSDVLEYLRLAGVSTELCSKVAEQLPTETPAECRLAKLSSLAAEGLMEVAVSSLSGETDTFQVWQWTTIRDLKAMIEARRQIAVHEMVLLKNGRELKGNDDTLAFHRITFNHAELEMVRTERQEVPKEEESLFVTFKQAEGIPDGSIISIRAGTKGRQTHLKLDEPLKFPITKEAASLLRLDIFSEFGKARLALRPGTLEYCAQVHSQNGEMLGCIYLEAKDTSEKDKRLQHPVAVEPSNSPSRRAQATVIASSYLDEHGLIQYLQGLLQSVLREKPADPYLYLQQQLQAAQVAPQKPPAQPQDDGRSNAAAASTVAPLLDGGAAEAKEDDSMLPSRSESRCSA